MEALWESKGSEGENSDENDAERESERRWCVSAQDL